MHGEKGFESSQGQGGYQSWSYYHEDFGIYDDDPEIVTLDSADFQRSVLGNKLSSGADMITRAFIIWPIWPKLTNFLTIYLK